MTAAGLSHGDNHWLKALTVKPEWSYAEAMYWIAFRSPEAIGAHLQYGRSPKCSDRPDVVAGIIELLDEEERADLMEPKPGDALRLALLSGSVQAWAEPRDATLSTREFTAADWQHLHYEDGPARMAGWVDRRETSARRPMSGVHVNMRFSRQGVMAAFPARTNAAAEGTHLHLVTLDAAPVSDNLAAEAPSAEGATNVPRENRSARKWLLAPDVNSVARERVVARGGDAEAEAEIRSELKLMLREQNWNVTDDSVDAIRRNGGFKARQD